MILVSWFTDYGVAYYIYFLAQRVCGNVLLEHYNTKIKQQLCGEEKNHIKLFKFHFYFVAIFVAFAPS